MNKNNIGVIGLAVMGSNLALNFADNDYTVSVFNRTTAVGEKFLEENPHKNVYLYKTIEEFIDSLEKPRKIVLMVQAGMAVDKVIESILPLLDQEDIIMDGGNSNFKDTIKRTKEIEAQGFYYMGVGISGGEEGARFGPAIMPGGSAKAYSKVGPMLEKVAAKKDGEACCAYIGSDGAGHYVKMVHNGIEYADMQLIAESYSLLKNLAGYSNDELSDIFAQWDEGELESYLIEITADIFKEKDPKTDGHLIDAILDKAEQKGTGKWTVEEALETGTDVSLLASAVFARFMSSQKDARLHAESEITLDIQETVEKSDELVEKIRQALYASKIIAYAQGFDLMKNASDAFNWNLDFASIAKIFREGCIIRARFLNRIASAYESDSNLPNLMLDDAFKSTLMEYQGSLREVSSLAIQNGISIPAFTNAVAYFDAYRQGRSNANLIQAQRDLFGAHTFERIDEEGSFHHEWSAQNE